MVQRKREQTADFSKIVPGAAVPKPKGFQAAVVVTTGAEPSHVETPAAPLSIADKRAADVAAHLAKKVIKIETAADLEIVDGWLNECKAQRDYFEALERPGIKAAHAAWKLQTEKLAAHQKPLEDFERKCKQAIVTFNAEQERIRRDAENKAREEAEADERERRAAAAKELRKAGEKEAAKAIIAAPLVVAVAPAPIAPKSAAVNMVERWKFDITDAAAIPRKYLMVDEKMIAAVVKAEKGLCTIPGVRVYSETEAVHKSNRGPTGF